MKKILFATNNQSKINRFKDGLIKRNIELISLADLNLNIDVEENGKDAIENALIKARAYKDIVNMPVLAMDDNLFLEGVPDAEQPGTNVRRVQGKRLTDEEMLQHYISLVDRFGIDGKITARWIYGIAIINDKEYTYTWSKSDFYLVNMSTVKRNVGYPLNSISINKKLNKYFTDMTEEDKLQSEEDESEIIDFIANSLEV